MVITNRRQRLRAILAGDSCAHPASVFDPISARIAADLGYELGMLSGSTTSLAVLGAPDVAILTLSELAEQTRRIMRATDLPLLVDADHGYGNALSVMRTVQDLEAAGASGLTIEDTLLPRAYASSGMELISVEEGLGKIRAALTARLDRDLVIVARMSAATARDSDDLVARVRAYAEAGPDALFLSGVSSHDQLLAVRSVADLPLILGGAKGDLGGSRVLSRLGVRIALQGNQPYLAAVQAIFDTLKGLRSGTGPLPAQASSELLMRVTRNDEYSVAIREFLGGG
jgi:carboxyvinyl-carboxyphosphonate phosphorylmutase